MKKIITITFASIILLSCETSTRGNWTKYDKEIAREEFNREIENSRETQHLTLKEKNLYIDCLLNKLEQTYKSPIEASEDLYGIEILGLECADKINANGSIKGNWSISDKQTVKDELYLSKDIFTEQNINLSKFIPLIISKFESNFDSYHDMNQNQKKSEKLLIQTINEFHTNGSKKGYWSKSDREKLKRDIYTTKEILINLGVNPRVFSECLTNKCEMIYESYYDANKDINGFQKIYESCL